MGRYGRPLVRSMAKAYVVSFTDGAGDRYVAYGDDQYDMPVYRVRVGEIEPTEARYPACMKFFPEGRASRVARWERDRILARYGPVLTAARAEARARGELT